MVARARRRVAWQSWSTVQTGREDRNESRESTDVMKTGWHELYVDAPDSQLRGVGEVQTPSTGDSEVVA